MVNRNARTDLPRTLCTAGTMLLVAGLVAGCQIVPPTEPDCGTACRAEFVFPETGEEVLSSGPAQGFEVALGRGDMPEEVGDLAGATVEYSPDGGESWRPAEVEALGQPSGLPHDPVLLRARGVPDGKLLLRASLTTAGGVLYQAQARPVTVWFTPKPKGKVTTAEPMDQGRKIRVKFDGTGSTDGKGNAGGIRGWEWDFGDGSPKVTGRTPTHTYQRRGKFMVVLCVTDAKGNRSYRYYKVDTGDDPRDTPPPTIYGEELPEWPDCRCTKMTVDHRPGAAFGTGYKLTGGVKGFTNQFSIPNHRSPAVTYGFEVIAEIEGNPDKCYEWQEIKRTSVKRAAQVPPLIRHFKGRRIGGDMGRARLRAGIKPRTTGEFPVAGGAFGLDGYDTPGVTKLHLPGIVRWRDRPGKPSGFGGGAVNFANTQSTYDYHADFLTIVGGPIRPPDRTGECACSFNIHIGVNQTGATTFNKLTLWVHQLTRQCVLNP